MVLALLAVPVALLALAYRPVAGRQEGVALAICVVAGAIPSLLAEIVAAWSLSMHRGVHAQGPVGVMLTHLLRPAFIALVHAAFSQFQLLPFPAPRGMPDPQWHTVATSPTLAQATSVRTLVHRPLAMGLWLGAGAVELQLLLGAGAVPGMTRLRAGVSALGWEFVCFAPFVTAVIFLGGRCHRGADAWACLVAGGWLWLMDVLAHCGGDITLAFCFERLISAALTTYLVVITSSLMAHIHTLCVLSPTLPPCPPSSPLQHLALIAQIAVDPPPVDTRVIATLVNYPLPSGLSCLQSVLYPRSLRLSFAVVLKWYETTRGLVQGSVNVTVTEDTLAWYRRRSLTGVQLHLIEAYDTHVSPLNSLRSLETIPHISSDDYSAYHLFASLIPRLAPIYPFLEICKAFAIDAQFVPPADTPYPLAAKVSTRQEGELTPYLPITTQSRLTAYAAATAGALSATICYLSWAVLEPSDIPTEPVASFGWASSIHPDATSDIMATKPGQKVEFSPATPVRTLLRAHTAATARRLGAVLFHIDLAASIDSDARQGRVYVPLSRFSSARDLLDLVAPPPGSTPVSAQLALDMLESADALRDGTEDVIKRLPRAARLGVRAAVGWKERLAVRMRAGGGVVVGEEGWEACRVLGEGLWASL